jgi:nucleotide-binding universal stress UspA family protein
MLVGQPKEFAMDARHEPGVVIGLADSVTGLHALRRGVTEARRRGVAVYAVRAWQGAAAELSTLAMRLARQAFVTALGGIPPDLEVHILVVEQAVGRALVGFADREDDLLVVGDSQRRIYSGHVARYCARHALCPVMVVPPPPLARIARVSGRRLTREARRFVEVAPPR